MADPLKLTDEVLHRIRVSVREACVARGETLCDEEIVAAIRALRDAAQKVVNCAIHCKYQDERLVYLPMIQELAALLPDSEVPRG